MVCGHLVPCSQPGWITVLALHCLFLLDIFLLVAVYPFPFGEEIEPMVRPSLHGPFVSPLRKFSNSGGAFSFRPRGQILPLLQILDGIE